MEAYVPDYDGADRPLVHIECDCPFCREAPQRQNGNTAPQGATVYQGTVSLINVLLGIGILSMPYAMSGAGAAGVGAVLLCCALFCQTGLWIHKGLDMMPDGLTRDYPALGEASLGHLGRHLVSIAAALELFGASCMSLIIMWRSTEQVLTQVLCGGSCSVVTVSPATVATYSMVFGIIAEALLCLFGTYKTLSGFSTVGCVSTFMVMLLVAGLPVLDPHKKWLQEAPEHHVVSGDFIPATAILALGVAGHSAFPTVRASMTNKSQFPAALTYAYIACAVATGAVCAVGYWYWGDQAHVLVTTDFQRHSPYAAYTVHGFGIQHLVEALVAVNVATKVPLYVIALQDIVKTLLGEEVRRGDSAALPRRLFFLRGALVVLVIGVSFVAKNMLADVESVSGAVSVIASSLLLPTLFYAALLRQRGKMQPGHWAAAVALVFFGGGLMVVVLAKSAEKIWGGSGETGGEENQDLAQWFLAR